MNLIMEKKGKDGKENKSSSISIIPFRHEGGRSCKAIR
jgi:hypothetical protein